MAEGDGLLNRCTTLKSYRGFESLRLRSLKKRERITQRIISIRRRVSGQRKIRPKATFLQKVCFDKLSAYGTIQSEHLKIWAFLNVRLNFKNHEDAAKV